MGNSKTGGLGSWTIQREIPVCASTFDAAILGSINDESYNQNSNTFNLGISLRAEIQWMRTFRRIKRRLLLGQLAARGMHFAPAAPCDELNRGSHMCTQAGRVAHVVEKLCWHSHSIFCIVSRLARE